MINQMDEYKHHPASFRDPSGFIFFAKGNYYRQVNQSYASNYELLMSSGLYAILTSEKKLIPHEVINENFGLSSDWYRTLLPTQLSTISYPYEWCFDQLKDAALLTLAVMRVALKHGMILKDASAFNVQFVGCKPLFIDSLSFEKYDTTKPWIAYRQFCECFLFPLLIGHYLKTGIQKMLTVYPEGIPVSLTAGLLPGKSRFNLAVWLHVFLQNSISAKKQESSTTQKNFSNEKMDRLIDHLESSIKSLQISSSVRSTWNNYYDETILGNNYLAEKERTFRELIKDINVDTALDIGCNNGYFSRIIAEKNILVRAIDFDTQCINELYRSEKSKTTSNIIALCVDIANPTPAIGLRNQERSAFEDRGKSDLVAALALVHHMVLGRNIPFAEVAAQMAALTKKNLIIEFVPLDDEKSKQLIANKTDYHRPYDENSFENNFSGYFEIETKKKITGTERVMYRMKKK